MKAPLLLVFLSLLTTQLQAERWAVELAGGPQFRVTNSLAGGLVTSAQGVHVLLYWAPDGETNEHAFLPVGASALVGIPVPGVLHAGIRVLPSIPTGVAMFQVRAFEAAYGATYEAAAAAPEMNGRKALGGKSTMVRGRPSDLDASPPSVPPSLYTLGIKSFSVDVFPSQPSGPNLIISDALVIEGNSGETIASFIVRLHEGGSDTVTVNFATADNSAVTPGDYTSTQGTLTFLPGETEQTISVAVIGDVDPENEETFVVSLNTPVNASISRAQAAGKIYNDDCVTGLTAATYVGVTINGCLNKAYRIEASYDGLVTWTALTNLTLTTTPYLWLDTVTPPLQPRVYRSVLLPPP